MEQIQNANEAGTIEAVTPGLEPFVAEFFEDRKKDLAQLKASIEATNYDSARKIAHNWKGFCEPYGFAHLGILASELEKALISSDTSNVQRLITAIEIYFANKKLPTETTN